MPIGFATLAASYPAEGEPCCTNGAPNFNHQCAIRMGICLAEAGLELRGFRGARCWHGHDARHVLRAQQLASWLRDNARVRLFGNGSFARARRGRVPFADTSYSGRQGIVFFQNFHDVGNQGDHMDLWDGAVVKTGALDYFSRSEEVWLWSMS